MSRARTAKPKFGVFAEGAPPTAADLSTFETLWFELSESCGGDRDSIRVYGFNKGQIRALKGAPGSPPKGEGVEPLDVLISRMHERHGFENAIIAFDRWPRNEAIPSEPYCLRTEVNFILEAFKRRAILPAGFLDAATALLERYRDFRKTPRAASRPPLGPLEFLFMDPTFEGLLVHDESAVLHALGLKIRPKDWPKFKTHSRKPEKEILPPAIAAAARQRQVSLRAFHHDKHGWALKIIRAATEDAKLWEHPIIERLEKLLVYPAPTTPSSRSAPRRPPARQRSR
jgi:hypothetical protein